MIAVLGYYAFDGRKCPVEWSAVALPRYSRIDGAIERNAVPTERTIRADELGEVAACRRAGRWRRQGGHAAGKVGSVRHPLRGENERRKNSWPLSRPRPGGCDRSKRISDAGVVFERACAVRRCSPALAVVRSSCPPIAYRARPKLRVGHVAAACSGAWPDADRLVICPVRLTNDRQGRGVFMPGRTHPRSAPGHARARWRGQGKLRCR